MGVGLIRRSFSNLQPTCRVMLPSLKERPELGSPCSQLELLSELHDVFWPTTPLLSAVIRRLCPCESINSAFFAAVMLRGWTHGDSHYHAQSFRQVVQDSGEQLVSK